MISKTTGVLTFVGNTLHGARFGQEDLSPKGKVLEIDQQQWEDLGRPEVITVTVRPGDILNDPEHPDYEFV